MDEATIPFRPPSRKACCLVHDPVFFSTLLSSQLKPTLTAAEYLAIERAAEFKSEFFQGEMFAMAGASFRHNQIVANVVRCCGMELLGGPCQIVPSALRLKVTPTGLYTYPDAMIVCGEPEFDDDKFDTLLNPTVVFEVLSDSTESYDRGTKSSHFRKLESLREYVLIAQDRVSVEVYSRTPDNNWLLREASELQQSVALDSVGIALSLSEIYRNVNLESDERGNPERSRIEQQH